MSDEKSNGDEELMSDFQDLFPEEEGEEVVPEAPVQDGSLDELDAFLDDFEKNLDVPDAEQPAADETAAGEAVAEVPDDVLELDKEALDLDVGLDGEVFAEEPLLDEDELVVEDEPPADVSGEGSTDDEDLLDLDVMMDEAEQSSSGEAAAEPVSDQEELELETAPVEPIIPPAAEPLAAATVASAAGAVSPPAAPALSKGQLIGGAVVLGASLLMSLSALWMGMGLGSQLETLNQNISELQQRVLAQSRRGSLAAPAQMGEQLNRLGERVNELAVIVEGPVGHLRESNQQALQALSLRLDRLEKGQSTLPLAARQKVAVSAARPLVSKAKESSVVPVPSTESKAVTAKKGWVINLLSVTSAKAANEELARLRKMGIRADKQTVNKEGKSWYRLRVTGFDSYEGAKAYIDTVEKQTGFKSAWVAKE